MAASESYEARADAGRARELAATASPFRIAVRFAGGLTERQRAAFRRAADRWTRVIVGDLPRAVVDGEAIDDVLIVARGEPIDGPGDVLGRAGPTHLRPAGAGPAALLPAKGTMTFDTADLRRMQASGTLDDVVAHEMGHVLGVGTLWRRKGLLAGSGAGGPAFTGRGAMAEYRRLRGGGGAGRLRRVPVEDTGGPGTRGAHWRESVFGRELMSGFVATSGRNPLSRLTAASLGDLGYEVDVGRAEPYRLPGAAAVVAAAAGPAVRESPLGEGRMLATDPVVLA